MLNFKIKSIVRYNCFYVNLIGKLNKVISIIYKEKSFITIWYNKLSRVKILKLKVIKLIKITTKKENF
jgi:hypothetical protein